MVLPPSLPTRMVPAFCCALDSTGSVVDYRRLPNILKRRISPSERERNEKVRTSTTPLPTTVSGCRVLYNACSLCLLQEKDLESFKDFVSRKRPEAVALAAESRYLYKPPNELALITQSMLYTWVNSDYYTTSEV